MLTHVQVQITIANQVCTNYVARFTGDRLDSEASLKPDITLFSKNNVADEDPDTASLVTSFLHMELFVELKRDTQYDPFRDPRTGGMEERNSINGHNTRGQCLLYAANQLGYQHRLFAFSLVICGKKARFIRWDREGVVVSAEIDCSKRHELVIEFLQRFNQLTAEQRGLDPTAVPATPEEIEAFESAVAKIEIEPLKGSVGDKEDLPAIPTRGPWFERRVALHRWEGLGLQSGRRRALHSRICGPRSVYGGVRVPQRHVAPGCAGNRARACLVREVS
jgi:hypothetical protein